MFLAFVSSSPLSVDATWHRATAHHPGLTTAWRTAWSWCLADTAATCVHGADGQTHAAGQARLRHRALGAATPADDLRTLLATARTAPAEAQAMDGTAAFVVLDTTARRLRLLRDAFGIRPAYWCQSDEGVWVSDDLECFARGRRLDRAFAAEFIALGQGSADRTVWEGVHQLPPGGVLTWHEGRYHLDIHQPWREPREVPGDDRACAAEFRRLIVEAVAADIDDTAGTWADCSGGHDSSSVAAIGGWLAAREGRTFRGGVTIVDRLGHGDESVYADDVARQYALPSIRVIDPWPWRDDHEPPPATPAPFRDYPHWARDRQVAREVRARGDGVLLSGVGPDYYLPLSPWYAVDLLGRGRLREALAVTEQTAIDTRSTVWHTLGRYVLTPLAPARLQAWWLTRAARQAAPGWLQPGFVADTGFAALTVARDVVTAWPGQVNATLLSRRLAEGASILPTWRTLEGLDIRHPLLSLPLVRFCLSLPRHLRTNFAAPKPILRQALEGIVPPRVLGRTTKGSVLLPRICWSLGRERARITRLLADSVLGAAGVIDPRQLLAHADRLAAGRGHDGVLLYHALSLESWLSARRDRGAAVSW